MIFSPMPITEFMSWVLMMVVVLYSWVMECSRSSITKDMQITTIINTHDMNSVMGIGENIIFIYKGTAAWTGNKDQIMTSTNKKLNDFIFASDLFKKVKEEEMANHSAVAKGEHPV